MATDQLMDEIPIYVQERQQRACVMWRLISPGEKRDLLVSCLAIEAILEYLGREEDQR